MHGFRRPAHGQIAGSVTQQRLRFLFQMGQHQLAPFAVGDRIARRRVDHLGIDQFVEDMHTLSAGECPRDRQELRQGKRIHQHRVRHRGADRVVQRRIACKRLAAGEKHLGRRQPGLDEFQGKGRIARQHRHVMGRAHLDRPLGFARAQRNTGDAVGFHLRLVEQSGHEHVITERDRADIARSDPAGIEMRPRGGDQVIKVARRLHGGHQRRPHRAEVHTHRVAAPERAIPGSGHLGHQVGTVHQRHVRREIRRICDGGRHTPLVERVPGQFLQLRVQRISGR